jgi:CRP/FNR family transcriptional regulator, cyclic AMP receptor protein
VDDAAQGTTEQRETIIALIEKVPLFADLTADDRKRVLSCCSKLTLAPGDILCSQGERSTSLYILLIGKLAVRIINSPTIATIDPVTSIGEMGVFTGEPRSATVEAMENSALLCLDAGDLNRLIEQNPSIGVKMLRRVIHILSGRVSADNTRIREFQNYIIDRETGG